MILLLLDIHENKTIIMILPKPPVHFKDCSKRNSIDIQDIEGCSR